MRPNILRSQSGMTMILALIGVLATLAIFAAGTDGVLHRVDLAKTLRNRGSRNNLASKLDQAIRDPIILHESLYDQTCLQNTFIAPVIAQVANVTAAVYGGNPSLGIPPDGGTCSKLNMGLAEAIPATDPNAVEDAGFDSVALSIPAPTGGVITPVGGMYSAPVFYNEMGNLCANAANPDCKWEVITLVRFSPTSSAFTNNAHYEIKYRLRSRTVINQSKQRITSRSFSGQAEIDLASVSHVGKADHYDVCRTPAGGNLNMLGGSITTDVRPDVTVTAVNPTTASQFESPICAQALGVKLCDANQWQIGLDAEGNPICGGLKEMCPTGAIPVASQGSPGGGIQLQCASSDCRAVVSGGIQRFGFVAPAIDGQPITNQIACVVVQPSGPCATNAKTGLSGIAPTQGQLICDTAVISVPSKPFP